MASACGSAKISLSAGQRSYSSSVKITLFVMTENSGKGSVNLGLSFYASSNIYSGVLSVTNENATDSNNYGFTLTLDPTNSAATSGTLTATEIPSGTYSVVMTFYDSSNQLVEVNSAIQEVTVYSGMTTDTWYINGKKKTKTDATSGTIVPDALSITKYDFTQLYVKGEDSTSDDGKLSLYTSDIFGTNIPEASDTTGTGAMTKPFATLGAAINKIKVSGTSEKEYTIYVDGTVTVKSATAETFTGGSYQCLEVIDFGTADENKRSIKITTPVLNQSKAVIKKGDGVSEYLSYGLAVSSSATSLTIENISIEDGLYSESTALIIKDSKLGGTLYLKGAATLNNSTINKVVMGVEGGSSSASEYTFNTCTVNGSVSLRNWNASFTNCILKQGAEVMAHSEDTYYMLTLKNSTICSKAEDGTALALNLGKATLESTTVKGGITTGKNGTPAELNLNGSTHGENWTDVSEVTAESLYGTSGGTSTSSTADQIPIPITMTYGEIRNTGLTTTGKLADIVLKEDSSHQFGIGSEDLIKVYASDAVPLDKVTREYFYTHYNVAYEAANTPALCFEPSTKDDYKAGVLQYAGVATTPILKTAAEYVLDFEYYDANNEKVLPGVLYETCLKNITIKLTAKNKDSSVTDEVIPSLESLALYQNNQKLVDLKPNDNQASLPTWLSEDSYKLVAKVKISGLTYDVTKSLKIGLASKGFVDIPGVSIDGTEDWNPTSAVFIKNRVLEINSFYMCDHEVTQDEFETVMGELPSSMATADGTAGNNPVNYVNWYQAITYCNKLSIKEELTPCYTVEGITDWASLEYSDIPTSSNDTWNAATCNFKVTGYRLPTEAEWEWAARGGENYDYAGSATIGDVAWYGSVSGGNGGSKTHEVKQKKANAYGLYDMCGNVSELCWDWYYRSLSTDTGFSGASSSSSNNTRLIRGGSYYENSANTKVTGALNANPGVRSDTYGFRVVRSKRTKPEGFVKVPAVSITGTETWTPGSYYMFIENRALEINSFYMCDHEVTRDEFNAVMRTLPNSAKMATVDGTAGNNPVSYVNWYDAIAYCNKLSIQEGLTPCYTVEDVDFNTLAYSEIPTSTNTNWNKATCNWSANGYRLPTEAEWEWAARGGENYTYAGSATVGDVAWYGSATGGNSDSKTHEVKQKDANGYGLYDMSGNVSEWCWDWDSTINTSTSVYGATSGSDRTLRGGNWYHSSDFCIVYYHSKNNPYYRSSYYGFRVVRNVE